MKRTSILIVAALWFLGVRGATADTLTSGNDGRTVIDVVNTPKYGKTTITWLADANFAASLKPDSPYWVPGINPDGSMSLGTAAHFIDQLNKNAYLGIATWRLPTTILKDTSCNFMSGGANFGYDCGEPFDAQGNRNPAYPYSELAGLYYNGLGGQAHNSIKLVHNSAYHLFKHLQPYLYWSSTAQYNNVNYGNDFWFQNGFEGTENEYDSLFVLPVSTTTTGTAPVTSFACAAVPDTCAGLLPGLGLNTVIPPARPSLRKSPDGTMVYDPVTNIAYLANANLAAVMFPDNPYYVSGINPNGMMNTDTLDKFLTALNNPAHPFLGFTGWTIPMIAKDGLNPSCTLTPGAAALPDYGYNCVGKASQLGELFYNQLSGVPGHDIAQTSDWLGLFFYHLESNYYWQCQPAPNDPPGKCTPGNGAGFPPSFSFLSGYQGLQSDPNELFVILVVPGDAIPRERRWW